MLVLHDDDTLSHKTIELLGAKVIPALESPERIRKILESLENSQHCINRLSIDFYASAEERSQIEQAILTSHNPGYAAHLKSVHAAWVKAELIVQEESVLPECFQFNHRAQAPGSPPVKPKDIYALAGYYAFDMSTGIMKDTYKSALASAHLAACGADLATSSMDVEGRRTIFATQHFVSTDAPVALSTAGAKDILALCRPPGHHCDTKSAGGYCYINNAVVAVDRFLQLAPGKHVGILDIDFHHGNGTQDYFYDRSDVMYISIHGQDEYPYYTGSEAETGMGEGKDFNINLPLPTKSSLEAYMSKLGLAIQRMLEYSPDFLLVSLGFDTYRLDPLGCFEIDTEDYRIIAHSIRSELKEMPALVLLEGGYVLADLGRNLLSFLDGWEAVK